MPGEYGAPGRPGRRFGQVVEIPGGWWAEPDDRIDGEGWEAPERPDYTGEHASVASPDSPGRAGGAGLGAAARELSPLLSVAGTPLRGNRGDVSGCSGWPARGAHEPLVARAVCGPRVCEERLRIARVRREGPGAEGHPAESISMERRRTRRNRARRLQDLRRSCGRDVSRHRRFARAHEHAGHADVGARSGCASRP